MKVNGSAIYASHPVAPYAEGKLRFTQLKDGSVNVIYLADENETLPPATLTLTTLQPAPGATVELLGAAMPLASKHQDGATIITIPEAARRRLAGAYAWTIHLSAVEH